MTTTEEKHEELSECEPPVTSGAWQDHSEKQCRKLLCRPLVPQAFPWLLIGAELQGGGGEAENTGFDVASLCPTAS